MPTAKDKYIDDSYPYANASEPPMQKETSITAHVVRMASVTMAFAELDTLCGMLDQVNSSGVWQGTEGAIAREFIRAVESLR